MKTTYLFLAALCLTACTKPVSAPVPDLPAPIEVIVAPPAVEVAPAADIAAPAAMPPDAAPTLQASPEFAPVVAAPVK